MRNKFLLIKLAGILGLVILVVLYIFFYFFPVVEDINKIKREIKLKQESIEDTIRNKNDFKTFTAAEWLFIQDFEKKSFMKFPVIRSEVDLIRMSSDLTVWIKDLAGRDQIKNMILISDAEDLQVNLNPLYSDKKILQELIGFTNNKKREIVLKEEKAGRGNMNEPQKRVERVKTPFGGMASRTITLGVSSDYLNCIHFLNHLSWGKSFIDISRIEIERGRSMPKILIKFKILYIDQRKAHE